MGRSHNLRIIIFIFLTLFLVVLAGLTVTGNFPPNLGIGNPTAKDILEGNSDADILKLDGIIYSNASDSEWIQDNEYTRGEEIGEVKKETTNTWWYRNLYASQLPKGTKVYTTNGKEYKKGDSPILVIVRINNELLVYQSLVEG